jgi:alcohol dehydrogenase
MGGKRDAGRIMSMKQFDFILPTKLIFGRTKIRTLNSVLPAGIDRVLVVTDKNVAARTPALEYCRTQLQGRQVEYFLDVRENPDYSNVENGGRMARDVQAELVIGLGGGSAMDAAKGIALMAANHLDLRRLLKEGLELKTPLPVVCVPTTSGSGSEATPYAVFTDPEAQAKIGYANPALFPFVSIIDSELTHSMPEALVISTGMDVLSHAVESYLSTAGSYLSDVLALHVIETVLANLETASRKNAEAMDFMAYSSMLAGIVIAHGGTILPHIMGYCLTMFHGVPHGRACAALLPAVLDFLREHSPQKDKLAKLDELFVFVGGARKFIEGLGVSTRLSSYGVQAGELEKFVDKVVVKSDIQITPAPVSRMDILNIFQSAL